MRERERPYAACAGWLPSLHSLINDTREKKSKIKNSTHTQKNTRVKKAITASQDAALNKNSTLTLLFCSNFTSNFIFR